MAESDEFSKDGFFSMIEKAVQPQFFFLILSFALFIDSTLVYFCGNGFRDVEASGNPLGVSLGVKITLAFLGFSGMVSIILPFVEGLSRQVYVLTFLRAWQAFEHLMDQVIGLDSQESRRSIREHKRVRPGEVREEAHETQSEFLYARYDEFRRRDERAEAKQRKTEFYAFCVLSLTCLNYWLPGSACDHTMTHWITNACASSTPIWFTLLFFWAMTFLPLHRDDWDSRWVYCPPLYRKLEAKEKEERERERKIQEEIDRNIAEARYDREVRERVRRQPENTSLNEE